MFGSCFKRINGAKAIVRLQKLHRVQFQLETWSTVSANLLESTQQVTSLKNNSWNKHTPRNLTCSKRYEAPEISNGEEKQSSDRKEDENIQGLFRKMIDPPAEETNGENSAFPVESDHGCSTVQCEWLQLFTLASREMVKIKWLRWLRIEEDLKSRRKMIFL